jgi:hypothetical protein
LWQQRTCLYSTEKSRIIYCGMTSMKIFCLTYKCERLCMYIYIIMLLKQFSQNEEYVIHVYVLQIVIRIVSNHYNIYTHSFLIEKFVLLVDFIESIIVWGTFCWKCVIVKLYTYTFTVR